MIPFCCCWMNKPRCQPFQWDSHLVHSLVMKTVAFCFSRWIFPHRNKGTIHIHPVKQIPADKARPALSCSDLAGLTLTVSGWPTATQSTIMNQSMKRAIALILGSLHVCLGWYYPLSTWKYISIHGWNTLALTFLYFFTHFNGTNLRAFLFMSSVWWERNLWTEEADVYYQSSDLPLPLSTLFASFFLWGWSDSLSLWVRHNAAQTLRLLWSSENASRSFSLFRSLFSLSFQSRESIRCTHTDTHTYTRLTSSPFPLSIQQPVII